MPPMTVAASKDESTVFAADLRVQNGCGDGSGGVVAGVGTDADAPDAVGSIFDEAPVAARDTAPCCDRETRETRGDKD